MISKLSNQPECRIEKGTFPETRNRKEKMKQKTKQILNDLDQNMREDIQNHPRVAIGISLVTGIFLGWWVKR